MIVTVEQFTEVAAGVPVPAQGFAVKLRWLYADGRLVGHVRELIDESPLEPPPIPSQAVLGPRRGPWTFILD